MRAAGRRRRPLTPAIRALWLAAGVLAAAYFVTSLVVVLNSAGNATGVVWLPSFPGWYYRLKTVLEWPFVPYFAALRPLQMNPAISYGAYALISRAPLLAIALLVALAAARRGLTRARRGA